MSPTRSRRALVTAIFAYGLLAAAAARAADDALSLADHAALTAHLDIIANDSGWPQPSVDAANAIFARPNYTPLAWEAFFSDYFGARPFTDRLFNYLQYPVFWWLGDVVNTKLQIGIDGPLMLRNVDPDWSVALAGPGSAFADDVLLLQDLYNSQNLLVMLGRDSHLRAFERQALFAHFAGLIDAHPDVLRKSVTLDRAARPYFGVLRMQVYMVLVAAAPALDAATKSEIAATLDLQDQFLALWNDFDCLFLENNLSDGPQRQLLYDYLASVPRELHNTVSITINDFLGNSTIYQSQVLLPHRPYGGVNIFPFRVGQYSENSFPPDVPPGRTDVYAIALAHEVNHVVDAYTIAPNPTLAARKAALISSAGTDHLNYLRSMFPDGIFVQYPQEFFASIANQWFTDSAKTIQLGLVRFDASRPDPINQALFIADIYARGGDSTFFYTIDTAGHQSRIVVPLERDGAGRIMALTFGGRHYQFTLDAAGDVTAYTVARLGDMNCDGQVDFFDIDLLLAALGGEAAWSAKYEQVFGTLPPCDYRVQCDANGDGAVDFFDIDAFLDLLGTR